jgi:hypothetical protein
MLAVPARTLNLLAVLVWIVGGLVLLRKGSSLLVEAEALQPDQVWPWLAAGAALSLGGIKGRSLL